ncbi:C6 transcription factor [Pyrenophora tritici-repentis]|nr:C6 transcription factor [Pyrenophora tritici-repentis]KAG9383069.1 C6 transcription factor [Pyrenophora tritici-repentis]
MEQRATTQQQTGSPHGTAKLSNHSPADAHDWSGDEHSSDDDANDRSQSGTSNKRKRPLSVSCETCKQRKVKCDRGAPACSWCLKNHSACVSCSCY